MNKEVKKISAMLEAQENARRQAIARAENELAASKKELEDLNAKIATADTAEVYKNLAGQIRDTEAVIEFCERNLSQAEAKKLPAEAYANIVSEVKTSFDAIKESNAKAISEEIDKLHRLLTVYNADVAELNKLLARAAQATNKAPIVLNARTIAPENSEKAFYLDAFYKANATHAMLNRFKV